MGNELSYVGETGAGCQIYRETSGCYVVRHDRMERHPRRFATLASAYAACQLLTRQSAAAPN
jgi:hypothetical protein